MPAGTAKLTFTSGTTGTPKGVCLSADSLLRVARELDHASKPTDPQHHLALLPLAILLENLGCYAALYAGATLSLPSQKTLGIQGASGVDVPRLLGYLAGRAPESLILVPQLLLMLVSAAEQKAFDPQTCALPRSAVRGSRGSAAARSVSACRCSKATAVRMRLGGVPQSPGRTASGQRRPAAAAC
jgi:long-subunit acyl-CoA synthetase (AMP-forming)